MNINIIDVQIINNNPYIHYMFIRCIHDLCPLFLLVYLFVVCTMQLLDKHKQFNTSKQPFSDVEIS